MTNFLLAQLGILAFAVFSALEEAAFTYPFRKISNEVFPDKTKFSKLSLAHRYGALQLAMILFVIGILAGVWTAVVCALVYWLVFDMVYSGIAGQGPLSLDGTAPLNRWLTKVLGKNAGAKKAGICLLLIIAINLIF